MKKKILFILLPILLTGCAGQYKLKYHLSIEHTDKKEILNQETVYTTTTGGNVEEDE